MRTRLVLGIWVTVAVVACGAMACNKGGTSTRDGGNVYSAADQGDAGSIRGAIRSNGFKINTPDAEGMTVLHHAAANDQGVLVELLIEELGADKTAKDKQGRTPMDIAQEKGAANAARALQGAE